MAFALRFDRDFRLASYRGTANIAGRTRCTGFSIRASRFFTKALTGQSKLSRVDVAQAPPALADGCAWRARTLIGQQAIDGHSDFPIATSGEPH
jgi:hypothetical protein